MQAGVECICIYAFCLVFLITCIGTLGIGIDAITFLTNQARIAFLSICPMFAARIISSANAVARFGNAFGIVRIVACVVAYARWISTAVV